MSYAEVSVNSPVAQKRTFSYGIPDDLKVAIGQAVWVPFGEKTLQGIVLELTERPAVEQTREISGIIDPVPLLSPSQVVLARWVSSYYLTPLFEAVALMLPPGFERRVITWVEPIPDAGDYPSSMDEKLKEVLEFVRLKGNVRQRELEKIFGVRYTRQILSQLVRDHWWRKRYELEKLRVKPRMVSYLSLKVSPEEGRSALSRLSHRETRQADLLQFFLENNSPIAEVTIKSKIGISSRTVQRLLEKDLISKQLIRIDREPLSTHNINLSFPLSLTAVQLDTFKSISKALKKEWAKPSTPEVFLLRGVTGSGKTEIYLRSLAESVRLGKRGLVLVPEISMTPQIIERFVSRFPGRVAVLHSELSLGEQFDEWWRIKNGEFDVVIGPRSAIFAPQPDLGLIIIDEEHEWTYKQQDISPHYHTREVARKLAEQTGAVVVLGSATPDVQSYYKALNGEYHLLEMNERVTPDEGAPLPQVQIVDLRAELKAGNLSLFSRSLSASIHEALRNQEQILLFLNRRGAAAFVECRNCGWVIKCRRCEIPLSYHSNEEKLICHQCNYRIKVPLVCPRCSSQRIKFLGVGTEKLEQETALTFPEARILRWDSDIIGGHAHSHQEIFNKFRAGGADILIGTQMIAKGLDLPGVTLVGAVSADIALNLPDFRAGERTFQLLSQVAGRAGRGKIGGKVIIQTYSPEHYAIQSAAAHDYLAFYRREIAYRYELNQPPFSRLARLTYSHASNLRCQNETEKMRQLILDENNSQGLSGVSVIGPAPAYYHRLRGKYRWQLVLRASDPSSFLTRITFPRGWNIDIDPAGLL